MRLPEAGLATRLMPTLCLAACFGCASVSVKENAEQRTFSNYAMAICLGTAFTNEDVRVDFNKSANGFMEKGNMPLEAYEELRGLVRIYLDQDAASKRGSQVQSAKCFDLMYSRALDELFHKYDPCKSEDGWFSKEEFRESCV